MIELNSEISAFVHEFIVREKLPASYMGTARRFYGPLAQRIERLVQQLDHVPVIGINGGQGTGKSTCSALVAGVLKQRGLRALVLSIDDLYFQKAVRGQLAEKVHPLLKTRGVPGTHEMDVFREIVAAARGEHSVEDLLVPRFDKGSDDRSAEGSPFPADGVDVILFEGWCIGASAQPFQSLEKACNDFELEQDADGRWRRFVNEQLAGPYAEAFGLVDYLVMLKPPCFEVIYEWRGEQEEKLRQRLKEQGRSDSEAMNEQELAFFISHYERLTRWMFEEMPDRADEVFLIGEDHEVFSNVRNPKRPVHYLVSTDLDASLLDEAYSWKAAEPALKKLASAKAGLVLNSSKTVSEMQRLATDLSVIPGLGKPVLVAENGGALAILSEAGGYEIQCLGRSREEILAIAHQLRTEQKFEFIGFADMQPEKVVELTGLSHDAAVMAMDRQSTEPILWNDSDERWTAFAQALEKEGIRAVRGGRFIHLMGPTDKAEGMAAALAHFQTLEPSNVWTVVALGDSPNDLGMLNAADIAVAIPNPAHKEKLQPSAIRCIFPQQFGPKGWNEAILTIIEDNA
ncbi:HAD-IIB family hydrolase [Pontiellaceae bacterium B1224]|nr:HAD-IIB family hydrolase [Pontiellaceae bacterium B1224]